MRPWLAPLAAAALLCLFASPSLAAFAHGLECTALGSAVVSSCSDEGCLSISSIGGSGQEGASVSLYGSDGHRCSFSSNWDATTDVGASLTFQWTQVEGPVVTPFSLTMVRTSGGVTVTGDLLLSGGGALYLYRGDELLSSTLQVSGSLEVTGLLSSSQIPTVDFETDGRRDLVLCSVSFPSLVVVGGSLLLIDRAVIVADMTSDGRLDQCRVTCTNPPGGSLSSLTISSQSLMVRGTVMTGLGQLHFSDTPAPDLLRVTLSITPSDGVSMSASPLEVVRATGGGGGGGGFTCPSGECVSFSSSRPSSVRFPPGSLVLRPGVDDGAVLRYVVSGSSSCSPDGVLASLTTLVRSTDLLVTPDFASMCAEPESVLVTLDDVVVGRFAVALDGSVTVSAPPGGPLGMAINEKGLPGEKGTKKNNKPKATEEIGGPLFFPSVVSHKDWIILESTFADVRTFCVSGTCVSGNGLVFMGQQPSGASSPVTFHSSQLYFSRSTTGSGEPSSVVIQDVSSQASDHVSAVSPSSGVSSSSSVVMVPVSVTRADVSAMRGYSVTVQLSPNLVLASPVVEYDYLSLTGGTQMFVIPEGNGRYTVDCVILGPGCGPTDSGTLFALPISAASGATDGTGTVSIEAVTVADCDNDPIPCATGGTAHVVIDRTPPSSASAVTATQVTTGNPTGATTAITVSYTLFDSSSDLVELYRAPHGGYPEYDDVPGSGTPASPPSYPPGPEWSQVTPLSTGSYQLCYSTNGVCWTEQPSSRDFYYYVVYVRDRFGNTAPVSAMTAGTLNYHLGDFTDGVASCSGDNHVDTADISALGSVYGSTLTLGSLSSCLDIGPTTNHRVSGRPLTDNLLNFQDLILAAINFSFVSAPADRAQPVAAATNSVRLLPASIPAPGGTFDAVLAMSGAGDIQGLSVQLDYDRAVLELVSAGSGELLAQQNRGGVVLTEGGNVDATLLGQGGGIAGEGELARVRFRVRGAGDTRLGIASVDARDVQNREVTIGLLSSPAPPASRTAIRYAYPDPFDRETRVEFTVAQRAPVKVGVFDVAGRHVRTLVNGVQDIGVRTVAWDGRDDRGARREAGVYLIRIEAAGARETRTVRLIQ